MTGQRPDTGSNERALRERREGQYRIRWANGERCNGYRCWPERLCIAERRVKLLGLFAFWWPISRWVLTEEDAMRDIADDMQLRRPLPPPRIILPEDMQGADSRHAGQIKASRTTSPPPPKPKG